jgi:hypothetical protein
LAYRWKEPAGGSPRRARTPHVVSRRAKRFGIPPRSVEAGEEFGTSAVCKFARRRGGSMLKRLAAATRARIAGLPRRNRSLAGMLWIACFAGAGRAAKWRLRPSGFHPITRVIGRRRGLSPKDSSRITKSASLVAFARGRARECTRHLADQKALCRRAAGTNRRTERRILMAVWCFPGASPT